MEATYQKQTGQQLKICMIYHTGHIHSSSFNYLFPIKHSPHNNGFVLFKRAGQNLVGMNIPLKKHFLVTQKHETGRI